MDPFATQDRMFLREIETRAPDGMVKVAFAKMNADGHGIPEILHLFRFKKQNTNPLVRFTEQVMRGPSPLSLGTRELIGTYLSHRNRCAFCCQAHAPVAAEYLGQALVDEVLTDLESSSLDEAHKELLRYVGKLADDAASVTADDIERLKQLGWCEESIYDALTVASLFKFYNTWNNGAGVPLMSSQDFLHSGRRLTTLGYCMDFRPAGVLRILWTARKELRWADLGRVALAAMEEAGRTVTSLFRFNSRPEARTRTAPERPAYPIHRPTLTRGPVPTH